MQSNNRLVETKEVTGETHVVQKYTLEGSLHEAVIVGGKPYFLRIKTAEQKAELVEKLELPDGTTLIPPKESQYLNKPYRFNSLSDIQGWIQSNKDLDIDDMFDLVMQQIELYVDRPKEQKTIYAADTIFTYFQDRLGSTHYLFLNGDNDSGKTSDNDVLESLMYRPLRTSGVTTANIYQYLGEFEEGQGTIIEDEADDIDKKEDKMRIYKVGYKKGTKIPRMDISNGRNQHAYYTFGFKVFAAERQLNSLDAKGLNDRIFYLHCYPGKPKHYIKDILENAGDSRHEEMKKELEAVRNMLFLFRLLHFNDSFPDVQTNITNRNRELAISLIKLFNNTEALQEAILPTLSKMLTDKQGRKIETLEARLFGLILERIEATTGGQVLSKDIWESFKSVTEGEADRNNPTVYITTEFGRVTQSKVAAILKDRFGAKKVHAEGGNGFVFSPTELEKLRPNYDTSKPIEIEILPPTEIEDFTDLHDTAAFAV